MSALVSYQPRGMDELQAFAERVTRTGLVPQAYRNKPEEALVAMLFGWEIAELPPLTSLQFIAVINGKPAVFGDAQPGIAIRKGMIQDIEECIEGEGDSMVAVCRVTKANGKVAEQRFSVSDAKKAGLWGKSGPWVSYPKRMLQWRARSWAIRDAAPHLLFGPSAEELRDIDEQPHVGAEKAKDVTPQQPANDVAPAIAAPIVEEEDKLWVYDVGGKPWSYDNTMAGWKTAYTDLKAKRADKVGLAAANIDMLRGIFVRSKEGSPAWESLKEQIAEADARIAAEADALDGMHAEPAEPVQEAA